MTRRSFFAAAAVAAATALAPSRAPDLRAVYRYSYATDSWTRCRLYQVRAGDVFRFDEDPSLVAHGNTVQGPDGIWSITADYQIDPATNQWVPV